MNAYVSNKKIARDYEILDTFEAGIVLSGSEVKSLRAGQGSLEGAYVVVRDGEVFLLGATIPPFQSTNVPKEYDPERTRTLLLSKKEIETLYCESEQRGLTIVPIKFYNKSRKLKLEIALVRGKKKHDKREDIKARDTKRDLERTMKGGF